jgi:hypothetical protein
MNRANAEPGPTRTTLADVRLSNAEIADRPASLARLLSTQKENPYTIKAYTRAAAKIRTLSESVDELVRDDADLTAYTGIGEAIASAIREIVLTGTLLSIDLPPNLDEPTDLRIPSMNRSCEFEPRIVAANSGVGRSDLPPHLLSSRPSTSSRAAMGPKFLRM